MCELFGLSFNRPVKPSLSFREFRARGRHNPHGWGIGYYPDASVQVLKEPVESEASNLYRFLLDYRSLESSIVIAHVRYASKGTPARKNTHPFARELDGREYLFAHNGTLRNYRHMNIGRFTPLGDTDSEYVFCALLDSITGIGRKLDTAQEFDWLSERLQAVNDSGTFNCLLSDGKRLFVYRDCNGYRGLHFLRRTPPYRTVSLRDEEGPIDLGKMKDPGQKGYVISTTPLTDENWKPLKPGELMVLESGVLIYSSHRSSGNAACM